MSLSRDLLRARADLGLTLDEMAARLRRDLRAFGMGRTDRQTVWRWETGAQEPTGPTRVILEGWLAREWRMGPKGRGEAL